MAKRAARFLFAVVLLGLGGVVLEPAAAASTSPPVTLRGTGTTSAAPADGNGAKEGSSMVLRGSTPPPMPSFAGFPCPPGYAYDPDTGCVLSGNGSSYASAQEYDSSYWPYAFGRDRPFRAHRHAATGFSRGGFGRHAGFQGMRATHGFSGHR